MNESVVVARSAEDIARQVLRRTNQSPPRTNLKNILNSFGKIDVIPDKISGDGYLLEFGPDAGEILVSEDSMKTARWKFTVAHELGHWILNRFAEKSDSDGPPLQRTTSAEVEKWCNEFAAAVLIPTSWLENLVGRFENLGKPQVILEGPRVFDVSREAFYVRLHSVYGVHVAELTMNGMIRVWPGSALTPFDGPSQEWENARERVWRNLASHLSASEWKRAQKSPLSKGPIKISFNELKSPTSGSKPSWAVLVLRRRLEKLPSQLSMHGFLFPI